MSAATDLERGQAILHAIARRLQTVQISDPCIASLTFTVHLRAGGGWPRGVTMRVEVTDEIPTASANGAVDACGPTKRNW